ncbi:uncharacterized protein LOC144142035 [Haemaphysalis longicornis]
MQASLYFVILTAFHIAACSVQYPELTDCSDGDGSNIVNILNVTVTDAAPGKTVVIDAVVELTETVGENPQLLISLKKPNGTPLLCVPTVLPCVLNLCGGTTEIEKELNKEWNNECPVKSGIYNSRLSFDLPAGSFTELYLGDGNVVVTFRVVDGGTIFTCKTMNLKFDV